MERRKSDEICFVEGSDFEDCMSDLFDVDGP